MARAEASGIRAEKPRAATLLLATRRAGRRFRPPGGSAISPRDRQLRSAAYSCSRVALEELHGLGLAELLAQAIIVP